MDLDEQVREYLVKHEHLLTASGRTREQEWAFIRGQAGLLTRLADKSKAIHPKAQEFQKLVDGTVDDFLAHSQHLLVQRELTPAVCKEEWNWIDEGGRALVRRVDQLAEEKDPRAVQFQAILNRWDTSRQDEKAFQNRGKYTIDDDDNDVAQAKATEGLYSEGGAAPSSKAAPAAAAGGGGDDHYGLKSEVVEVHEAEGNHYGLMEGEGLDDAEPATDHYGLKQEAPKATAAAPAATDHYSLKEEPAADATDHYGLKQGPAADATDHYGLKQEPAAAAGDHYALKQDEPAAGGDRYVLQDGEQDEKPAEKKEEKKEEKKKEEKKPAAADPAQDEYRNVFTDTMTKIFSVSSIHEKRRLLLQLYKDFVATAKEGAAKIDRGELESLDVGGVAGGKKFYYKGVFFKEPEDKLQGTSHLYGGKKPSSFFAAKATANEVKASNTLLRLMFEKDIPIVVPFQGVVDVRGKRILAMSNLPLTKKSLIYGSNDGGTTIHHDDEQFNSYIEQSAEALHLAKHAVQDRYSKVHQLCLAGDVEGHKIGTSYFLLDLSRVFPPEKPQRLQQEIWFRLFRPEFLVLWKRSQFPPLSSDGLSPWGAVEPEPHTRRIRRASRYIRLCVIPNMVRDFEERIEKDRVNWRFLLGQIPLREEVREDLYNFITSVPETTRWPSELVPILKYKVALWYEKNRPGDNFDPTTLRFNTDDWERTYDIFFEQFNISTEFHRWGVAIRHLVDVYKVETKDPRLKQAYLLEMVKRSSKQIARWSKATVFDCLTKIPLIYNRFGKYFSSIISLPEFEQIVKTNAAVINEYVKETCAFNEPRVKPNTFLLLTEAQVKMHDLEQFRNEGDDAFDKGVKEGLLFVQENAIKVLQSDPEDSAAQELLKKTKIYLKLYDFERHDKDAVVDEQIFDLLHIWQDQPRREFASAILGWINAEILTCWISRMKPEEKAKILASGGLPIVEPDPATTTTTTTVVTTTTTAATASTATTGASPAH